MFKSYRSRLFAIIFGVSVFVYLLSFVHIIKGIGNNIFTSILILLISVFIAMRESKYMSYPLEKLNECVKRITNGEYDYNIDIDVTEEFAELSKNFNKMSSKLKSNYEELKKESQELIKKNNELQDLYMELEASYEQMEAVTNELEASESRYRTLVDNMSDILWFTDKEYNVEFINNRSLKFLDYLPDEMIGKKIFEYIDDDKKLMEDLMTGKINMSEIKFKKRDGSTILTETRVKLVKNSEDELLGIQGLSRDITDYCNAKKEILERNRQILAIGNVTQLLTKNLEPHDILYSIAEKISTILSSPLCTIRTVNESGKLELMVAAGELKDMPLLKELSLTSDENVKLLVSKEITILDANKFPADYVLLKRLKQLNVKNIISVPLISKDKAVGTLNILTTSRLANDISLLRSVADSVSIAIENANLYDNLRNWYLRAIDALAYAVEAKDRYTKGHSLRVSKYAAIIGESMGLPKDEIEKLKIAGILHDIGKIGISDKILTKPGKLTKEEYDKIKQHPSISRKILEPIGLSKDIIDGIEKHHERYDGKGYPFGLDDDNIPLIAAILCVADSFDAMTSDRSYRKGMPFDEAVNELLKYKGTQFNPRVVDSVISIYMRDRKKIERIKREIEIAN
ncbi:putative PAS/PAC sensor protein [Thermoanaerobacterium thermosaccharolyticum DSM 571]|uniref:Putative PAS/PAC sensor protein n=1 Tax=Thermoanaerobacterium thermosaccharolyticum (strain ATCC 7956 / DSM 571 / NCIMB 9385 / NCA 3814 / NCTC 13789 / WDCM 00135 / 2032) TaxID=580327 RepID=D9TMW3_THETC|nr:HD domain-containing phosphohydrolase [Thermoanaerobacterium thermosaccharolyticum]ADL67641.1 putative PAS/PAC sensor protein [Thermoanaerobacterium thermosaccharolyticum DSM 571]